MSSPVRRELEDYLAGRTTPERVVVAVTLAFYRDTHGVQREALRPLINVIDRASPGVVELGSLSSGRGFEVRLAERPFPREHEAELRRAAEEVLRTAEPRAAADSTEATEPRVGWVHIEPQSESRTSGPTELPASLLNRILGAMRRLFSR